MNPFNSAANRAPRSLTSLQRRYGSFNPNQWQNLRRQFYSNVQIPAAGVQNILFFGNTLATAGFNKQLTNIPKPGSFGTNHMLIKAICLDYFIADLKRGTYASTDATTLSADVLYGMFAGGVLEFKVGARKVLEIPLPFLQCPPGNGTSKIHTAGLNTIAVGTGVVPSPSVELATKKVNRWILEPEILIQAEEQFEVAVNYPSGTIPLIATSIEDDATNKLYVQCLLDGIVYRPTQ